MAAYQLDRTYDPVGRDLADEVSASFWEMFLVVIQLGAILAVVVLYWKRSFR